MSSWEHFAHDTDIGIRGIGSSIDEAFAMYLDQVNGLLNVLLMFKLKDK